MEGCMSKRAMRWTGKGAWGNELLDLDVNLDSPPGGNPPADCGIAFSGLRAYHISSDNSWSGSSRVWCKPRILERVIKLFPI